MRRATRLGWIVHELRRLGRTGLAMPIVVLSFFGGIAALLAVGNADSANLARLLVAGLELGLPLAAGLVAASVVEEPAVDLQLSLKTSYRSTLARRLVLLVGWNALVALSYTMLLKLAGLWGLWGPGQFLKVQLVWLSPLLLFVSVGVLLALLFRSRAAAVAILGGVWILENLFYPLLLERDWLKPAFLFATTYVPGADFWLQNRLVLIGFALALTLAAWTLAASNERLLAIGGGE